MTCFTLGQWEEVGTHDTNRLYTREKKRPELYVFLNYVCQANKKHIRVFPKRKRNSGNLRNYSSMNWGQFKAPLCHLCLHSDEVSSQSLTQEVVGSRVTLFTKTFDKFCRFYRILSGKIRLTAENAPQKEKKNCAKKE